MMDVECTPAKSLPLVPWKHDWAVFLSNVVSIGAYWWSFFTMHLMPAVPETVKLFKSQPVHTNPVLAQSRK